MAGETEEKPPDRPEQDPSPGETGLRIRRLLSSSRRAEGSEAASPPEPHPSEFSTLPTSAEKPQTEEALGAGPEPSASPDPQVTPRASRRTPPPPPIARDESELPRRVPERDPGATRVAPAAYVPPPPSASPTKVRRLRAGLRSLSPGWGCLLRMSILGGFGVVGVAVAVASFGVYQYFAVARTLPSVEDLQSRAAQFETTRILDREGNLLYEILDPQAGRRTYVPLSEISPYMVAAVIATEDSQFYSHPGFDPLALARAISQNLEAGEIASGASTITQQIARNLLLSPEERSQRTAIRKIREIMLAAEITRRYSKDQILELYLNQMYFGNLAYGVEAAAETYFNTSADRLTLSQASFLAGLLQAPSVYDIFTNREATLARHRQVLMLMVQTSNEQGCIYVSNSQHAVCVPPEEAGAAAAEIEGYAFNLPAGEMRFPHWVNFVRSELEAMYDPQTIYRSGFTVYTTLDPDLQRIAEEMVATQVGALADRHVTDGALVAIRPDTGEILAMVGSADYNNEEIDGQVNMAVRPRQPGSSIKPLTYAAAFAAGWTPATLIWDVPSQFPPSGDPSDTRPPYEPVNYDERFHGPVTVRTALANSYNVPAVKTLDFIGIYDDPATPEEEGLVPFARRMGITTLTRPDYGLSLTLGGGEVTLLDLTGAYAVFANGGLRIPPVAITRIVDHTGAEVYAYEVPAGDQVVRPEHAYLISSILSDNAARMPMFGPNSVLNLPFPVAAKTGTTNDFRDNWTLGYTPDLAVGVWVGNADWTPMQNTTGLTGAAPIWNQFMQTAIQRLTGGFPTPFMAPPGIMERVICAVSGAEPSEWCPSHRSEIFAADQPPLPSTQDLWQRVWVDSWALELASGECADYAVERQGLDVTDPWARRWLEEDSQGREWLEHMDIAQDDLFFIPHTMCSASSPRPILALTAPHEGEALETPPIEIIGRAAATGNFERWELHHGGGNDPSGWDLIAEGSNPVPEEGRLTYWTPSRAPNGAGTLRLVIFGDHGRRAETRIHIFLSLAATPTPTPTLTPTVTPTATLPPTPTETPPPPPTFTPTPSPSETPTPTDTESPTPTV